MSIEHPEHRTDSLPSLDETAKVPVTHSDKVHGDENWSGVQETFHGTDARLDATQSDRVLTGQRTVEEELGERAKENKGHMPWIAGAVATAIVVGGGLVLKFTGGDKEGSAESPAPTPDTTATATTGETSASTDPAELIGTKQTDYNTLNVQPTEKDTQKALMPLAVADYTPEQAIVEFGKKMNVYNNGAAIDNDSGDLNETSDSVKKGDEILASMFGEERVYGAESSDFQGFRNIREMIGNRFNFYAFNKGNLSDKDTGKAVNSATANESWSVENLDTSNSDLITATITVSYYTNFEQIDRDELFDNPGIDEPVQVTKQIEIEVVDGTYRIKSLDAGA